MNKDLFDYLKSHGISYKEYHHPAMFKVADEEKIKANIPGMKSKNLFLKDSNGKFYLIIWEAYSKLPINKLKKRLKVKDLEFASPEELKSKLNVLPGSVSIFAMINAKDAHLIIDSRLWLSELSGYHPNDNTSTLVISKANLHNFVLSLKIQYEVVSFE